MGTNRPALLWSSVAVVAGFGLWLITLHAAQVIGGNGDSIRLLFVAVGTNLAIVAAFFLLAGIAQRAGYIKDLQDRSAGARATVTIIGILSALTGYAVGHLLIELIWGRALPLAIGRSLTLNVTIIPIVMGVLLVFSTFLSLGFQSIRSHTLKKGVVFGLALVPAMALTVPVMVEEIAIYMNALWQPTMSSYRGPIHTPENEFTVAYVEQEVVEGGRLAEVVRTLADQGPDDLIVLVQGVPESGDGGYSVSWHGIDSLVASPPAGLHLAVGFSGFIPPGLEAVTSESLRTAIRVNPIRMELGDDRSFVMYTQALADPAEGLVSYLFQRAGVKMESGPMDRHLINVHQDRISRWGRRGTFDAMRIALQSAGNSWTVEYDPQSDEFQNIYKYVYHPERRSLLPDDQLPHPPLGRLKGRRIIVDALPQAQPYYGNHLGICLATEVVNARHGLGFRYVPGWAYVMIVLVFQFLAFLLFVRFRSVSALWLLVLAHAGLAATMTILFVEANIIAAPIIFWASNTTVAGVLFITGFLREQREAVEQRTRLETELNTAREMQLGLMPTSDPQIPGFDIAGLCRPANEVGGDFYAYLQFDKREAKFGIAVADVSGKAMKAAVTAIMTSGMLYEAAERSASPSEILDAINTPLHDRSDKRVFTAMVVASLEAKGNRRTLTIANAGQTPPLMVRKGTVKPLKIEGVRLPLGVKQDVRYPKLKTPLQRGDLVFFYTDGLTESSSGKGEQYGEARLFAFLKLHAGERSRAIVDGLMADVRSFTGEGPLFDDLTVVAVKVENT